MRNLKRALSLALASVMLLGMMVVGSSAKGIDDFTDKAEIVNQDAVAVTSAIGMFEGYEDGSFGPENVVTRAEMAVIICTMLYGAGVNVNQFAETSVFTDVPAWAQGYVNLCSSLGIVAGVGEGKFDPNATVTTAQAVLMLCRALGYFQNAADFGDNWMLAATAKGTALGLYGDLKLTANAGLTRDNVAELVFNALTKAVPVQYNELLGVYYNENQGIIYSLEFNYLQTLGYKNFDLVYKTDTETIYGRPATTWGTGSYNVKTDAGDTSKTDTLTEDGGLIASMVRMLDKDEIITVPNTPTYTYTTGTDEDDVYKDLGKSVCDEDDYEWTVYVNGEKVYDEGTDVADTVYDNSVGNDVPERGEDADYQYTGKGTVTEIYVDDADATVTVVAINYYMGQVSKVKTDDDGEYINVKALSNLSQDDAKLDDRDFYVEGYEEDDYIVFTIDQNEDDDFYIAEVITPEVATGEVSRVENDRDSDDTYLKLDDGTKYPYSGAYHIVYDLDSNTDEHPELGEDYDLYLDPNGYVLGFKLAGESETKYLYVQDSDEELRDWVARVDLADGTSPKVELKDTYKNTDGDSVDIAWDKDASEHVIKNATNIDERVWAYTVSESSNVYSLKEVNDKYLPAKVDDAFVADPDAEIKNGKAYVSQGDNEFIVDKQTIFVDTMNNVAYIGYDEVPNVEKAQLAYVMDGRVAEIVFILDGEIYDEDSTYFYLTSTKRESLKYDGDYYWEYFNAYVDGQKQSVFIDQDLNALKEGTLYKAVKTTDEQYITEYREVALEDNVVNATGDDAFWLTTAQSKEVKFDTDDETVFVYVEMEPKKPAEFVKAGSYAAYTGGWKYSVSEGGISDMILEDEPEEQDGIDYLTYVTVVEKDEEYAELVYIIYKPVVDPIISYTVTVDVENADVTIDGEPYTGPVKVVAGTKITVAATAKPGYSFAADPSGEYTITGDRTINAKATANGRTITVNGNATGDKDSAKTDEEVVVTLTPKEGYTITSVDCNVTAKIDTKNWTVTIPAGLENVVIDVDTDPDVYTVTYDETSEWWSGRHMIKTSGETTIERDGSITVELTTDFIGATNAQVKVTGATGEFTKVNGVDQKTDSTTISTEAELKVLQNQFGTIYSDAACENPVAGAVTPSMTVYWITVEGQAAVWTGTISNPTGNVTVELDV